MKSHIYVNGKIVQNPPCAHLISGNVCLAQMRLRSPHSGKQCVFNDEENKKNEEQAAKIGRQQVFFEYSRKQETTSQSLNGKGVK